MRVVRRALSVVTAAAVVAGGLVVTASPTSAVGAPPLPTEGSAVSRPDGVSARMAARASGNRVDVLDERDESVTVWANPDGSMTREEFAAPVRVKDAAGEWQNVDATLVREGSTVRPRAVPYQVRFSAGGSGELASLSDGTHRYALSWPGTLPAPVLSGATATYPNVEPGTDLVLTATRGGFEQSLVLRTRPARPVVYRLPVTLTGLTMHRGPVGEIRLENAAGDLVMRGPAPVMYDARRDAAGQPTNARGLAVAAESGPNELVIAPDVGWLADPATEYPVVLDPTTTLGRSTDTYVESGVSAGTNFNGSTDLKIGLRATGSGNLALRSFVTFGVNGLAGKHILSATFKLWNYQSFSCTPSSTFVETVTAAWNPATVTWNNQPSTTASIASSSSIYGFTGCPTANWMNYGDADTRDLVQGWVDGTTPNYGVRFHASETDTSHQRKVTSGDAPTGNPPSLEITYNSYPMSPMGRYVVGSTIGSDGITRHTPSTAPILGAAACDADGNATRIDFEVWNATKTTIIAASSTSASSVASCMPKEWTVSPTLSNGTLYHWRLRAHDGTDYSKTWSSWVPLDIDTTAPPAPTVSSTTFTNGSWYTASNPSPLSTTFTLAASPTTDVAGYYYSLDDPDPSTFTTSTSVGLDINEGWHTLYVQTVDKAGNRSSVTSFAFGYGHLGVTSPKDGARTAKDLTLSAVANTNVTQVTWEVVDPAGTRTPLTGLSDANGPVTNPLTVSGGVVPTVTWNLENQSPVLAEGPIQLSATVTVSGSPVPTRLVPVTFDRSDFDLTAATTSAGPGEVNLMTGNLQLSATDASLGAASGDLSVGRTFNSRADDVAPNGPFGPGWVMDVPVESAQSDYTELAVDGLTASLTLNGGDSIGFHRSSTATATFTAQYGFEEYVLSEITVNGVVERYDLTDLDGNVTQFTARSTTKWLPEFVERPGDAHATTYEYETVTIGTESVTRATRIIARQPDGVAGCVANPETVVGCRSLKMTYFAPSVTPPSSGLVGDYPNRLQKVEAIAYNAAKSPTPGMDIVVVATYAYDSTGRLAQAWDPRLSTPLKTTYTYNGDGQVATVTPPAEEPWTLAYAPSSSEASGTGRLKSVSRPTLLPSPGPPTATTTLVYDVPVAGTGAPHTLSATEVARWGQQDVATTGTAIFPATTTASFGGGSIPVPSSWDRATVHYLNIDGREVNTVDPNGGVSTAEYDSRGNVLRTLTPGNRARALAQGQTTAQEAAIAQALSSLTVYSADGIDVLEAFGPEHEIALSDSGELVRAREHITNTYDEGMSGTHHLVTTSVISARLAGEVTDRNSESRTRKAEYGTTAAEWTLGQPTASVIDAKTGGLNLTTRTTYAADGRVLTQTLPSGGTSTNTAATRVTRYYSAGVDPVDAACGLRPEWVDLVCSVGPGGQPSGVALPSTYTTYGMFNEPLVVTEKASGSTLRTATLTYDAAGRPVSASITATTGTALSTRHTTYDSNGRPTEAYIDASNKVVRTYDSLGRITSYTDTDGTTSTITYDVLGRPATMYDGKGTQTMTYDGGSERRGLPTQVVDTHAGTFSATYDVDGVPTLGWPNGLQSSLVVSEAGSPTSLSYIATSGCSGADCTVLTDVVHESIHGQWLDNRSTLSAQKFAYDAVGRLGRVDDTVDDACTVRKYTYDTGGTGNTNRTKLETFASPDVCQTSSVTSTVNSTYDAADRITTSGTVYDALGRTTTVPDADALGSGALTVGYYANDLVRSIAIAGGVTKTYTLDVDGQRIRSWTDGTTTRTNHYSDDGDSPSWTQEEPSAFTRNIRGLGGGLAAVYDSATATSTLQLTNLHGDIVATMPTSTTIPTGTSDTLEFGATRENTGARYAWLGSAQRAADTPGGVAVMGARLYNPGTGRFLQRDPVYGGSANGYEYAGQDPINAFDLTGLKVSPGDGGPARACVCTAKNKNWRTSKDTMWGAPGRWLNISDVNGNIAQRAMHLLFTVSSYLMSAAATKSPITVLMQNIGVRVKHKYRTMSRCRNGRVEEKLLIVGVYYQTKAKFTFKVFGLTIYKPYHYFSGWQKFDLVTDPGGGATLPY